MAIVNLAVGPRTFTPSPLGKAATAIFMLACVVVMLFNYLGYHSRVGRCGDLDIADGHPGLRGRLRLAHRQDHQQVEAGHRNPRRRRLLSD